MLPAAHDVTVTLPPLTDAILASVNGPGACTLVIDEVTALDGVDSCHAQ
jgi:hypothetical protein